MKILLAVDGSAFTKKMLAYVTTHEELFTSANDYTLFTVQPVLPARARSALGKDIVDSYYAEAVEAIMAPASKFLTRHNILAKSQWKIGAAGDAIAKLADAGKFDLVLMGSHGHGTLTNLVMGSVATKVLARCTVPVLLVR